MEDLREEIINMCKVSVVIPTYSRNSTLDRAIKSVLDQTFKDFEIIVIDDNPVDSKWRKSTELLMQKYIDNEKIRYIKNEKNMGGSGARNVGIKASKGEYIAFLDDDDEYLSQKVEKQLEVFERQENKKLALVYSFCEYMYNGKVVYNDCKAYRGQCLYELMTENCIAATSQWMVRKASVLNAGMFPIVPSKQDSQMMLRLLTKGYEIDYVPEILSRYYLDDDFVHISTRGMSGVNGERLYREECRKYYYLLKNIQILEVEYSFAKNLYEKYDYKKMRDEATEELRFMLDVRFFVTVIYLTKYKLKKMKRIIRKHYKVRNK